MKELKYQKYSMGSLTLELLAMLGGIKKLVKCCLELNMKMVI